MGDKLITDFYKNVKKRTRTFFEKEDDQPSPKVKQIEISKQKSLIESNNLNNRNQLIDSKCTKIFTQLSRTITNRELSELNQEINNGLSNDRQTINSSSTNHSSNRSNQIIKQFTKSNHSNNQNVVQNNQIESVQSMREVFTQAQYIKHCQFCIQSLHKFITNFEFHEFYAEFCRNVKYSLEQEHENPGVKNILDTISSFLLSVKRKYSVENLKRLDISKKIKSQSNVPIINNTLNQDDLSVENDENNMATEEIIEVFVEQSTRKSFKRTTRSTTRLIKKSRSKSTSKSELFEEIHKVFRNLIDFVLDDVLLPYLNSKKISIRLNVCYLLGKLINSIDDSNLSLFDRVKVKLLQRLIDKSQKIRSSVAYLLYRFQDNQNFSQIDIVKDGLCYHLQFDSSPAVRLSCLNVILINEETLPLIITRIRDSNLSVRLSAFIKLSKKINFKEQLNKEDRIFLIKNGLNDRQQSIIDAFKDKVVSAWVRSYDENLIDLLKDLELCSDESNLKFIEQFIFSYFELIFVSRKNPKKFSNLSKFHLMTIDFRKKNLDEEFLIKTEYFNNESFFLWSCLTKFLKCKEDRLDKECLNIETRLSLKEQFKLVLKEAFYLKPNQIDEEENKKINEIENDQDNSFGIDKNNNQTVNIPLMTYSSAQQKENQTIDFHNLQQESVNEDDPSILDLILPKFSKFIDFLRTFCESMLVENDQDENIDFEFIFKQLILFLQNYEIVDSFQRSAVLEFVEKAMKINFHETFTLTEILINYVKANIFTKRQQFFDYLISLLHLLEMKEVYGNSFQLQIDNHPIEYINLLQIFEVAINHVDCFSSIESEIDHFILPCILSTNSQLRHYALKALNQGCFKSREIAYRFRQLYFNIIAKDNPQIKNCALQGLVDSIIEYGGEILYDELSSRRESDRNSRTDETNSENDIENNMNQITNLNDEIQNNQIKNEVKTLNEMPNSCRLSNTVNCLNTNDEYLMNKSQFIEMDLTRQSTAKEEMRKRITKEFIKFLLVLAKDKDEKLSDTSIMGICKLMLLGRIYSPKLLSELILIYFNSNTNQSIVQTISTFLPIYCPEFSSLSTLKTKLPQHLTGQHCLFECFMSTIENMYRLELGQQLDSSFEVEHSNYYDRDIDVLNVIQFMLNLLEPINHAKMAIEFCERILEILEIDREDEYQFRESYATKYLIRSLDSFNLLEATDDEKNRLRAIVEAIQSEDRYEELKKPSISRIYKFSRKI